MKDKVKRKRKGLVILFIIFCLSLSGFFMMGNLLIDERFEEKINFPKDFNECRNLPLEDTAYCMSNFVRPHYNFNLNYQDQPNRDLQEVLNNGGSCLHYSKIYLDMAKELGFKGDYLKHGKVYDGNKRIVPRHRWTVIWDENVKCEIDQLNVKCKEI